MRTPLLLLFSIALAVPCELAAQSKQEHTQPVTIGVVLPLTGGYADWAQHVRQGLELAKTDAVRPFVFEYHDEGPCDAPTRSLSAIQKLMGEEVRIVVSGCLAGTKVLAPVAKQHGLLLMSPGLLDRDVLSHHYPLINLATEIAGEARYLAQLIAGSGAKRLAAIRTSDAFPEEVSETLASELSERGVGVVLNELVTHEVNDFRSLLTRAKAVNADALFMNTLGKEQQVAVMRQRAALKLALPVFSNYVLEGNAPDANERKDFEGVRYTYPLNSAEASPAKLRFDRIYKERFASGPIANAYFAYDGLLLLDTALSHCEPTAIRCLQQHIANAEKRRGISGEMTIKSDGSNSRPYGFKQVQGGQFAWLPKEVP